jgi:hypothetical protein
MSASNQDGLPPALALDETPAKLGALPESIARQVPDFNYPALSSPGWYDAREASAATPLPPNLLGETLGVTFDTRTDGDFRLVKLADIAIGERLRGVVEPFVDAIVQSTSTHDFIQPPVVRPDLLNRGKFILVSGLQRINAAHLRGKNEVLCRVAELTDLQAALWEIDENLVRAPLSPAEVTIFIDRRRELHEQLYGKAKALGAAAANAIMGRKHATAKLADASSFTADTAKTTGKSPRTIQRVVQRAAQNGRTDLARIAGTSLDRGAELDALPLLPPTTRDALIEQAVAGFEVSAVQARKEWQKPTAQEESSNTATALRQLPSHTSGLVATDFIDNDLSTLKAAWNNASKEVREKFLAWIAEHQSNPDYRP